MHKAQSYFDSVINPSGIPPLGIGLNPVLASNLQNALMDDAKSYLYSAVISVGDAVQALQREMFSWSTVKLYYAVFYALRASLAVNGHALIYHHNNTKHTPYRIKAASGQSPLKLSGNTHKVVLEQYEILFPTAPIVTQAIGVEKPFNWMINRREEANYKNARFYEPLAPPFFGKIVASSIRHLIYEYIGGQSPALTFDPDHAILAMPIAAIKEATKAFKNHNPPIKMSDDDIKFLLSLFRDSHSNMPEIRKILP